MNPHDETQTNPTLSAAGGEERWCHPQLQSRAFWWLECTVCGPDSAAGGSPLVESEADAWSEVTTAGWTRRDDGRILCRVHSAVADCDALGHVMRPWAEHPIGPDLEWRFCSRCGSQFAQRVVGPSQPAAG